MANDHSTTAREFGFGTESRPSLTDWLIRDLRIAGTTERPPPAVAPRDDSARATVAAPPKEVEAEVESFEPQIADAELERYESRPPAEAIDDEVGSPIATSALLAGAAVAAVSHEVLPPPLETEEREPARGAAAVAPVESSEPADTASTAAISPPEDWLEEDEMGAAGAFFTSSADFDEGDELAKSTDEGLGTSLTPHVLAQEEDEEDNEAAAPLMVAGERGGSSRWKTIAAIAAAVLLALLFGQRLAKRHAQATAAPPALAIEAPKVPTAEVPREEVSAATEEPLPADGAKTGKGSPGLGGGRTRGGADAPASDPSGAGGPSVARFPDLPREILNQLEQVFESDSIQRNKGATESTEGYTH